MSALDPAVPRRAGRQPAATAGCPRGQGAARRRGHLPRRAARRRGRGDRGRRRQGRGDRHAQRHRRRVPPGLVPPRLPRSSSTASPSPATSPPAPTPPTTVHMTPPKLSVVGPLRHVQRHPGRRLPLPRLGDHADAEGVDPLPDDGPLPRRPGGDRHPRLPRPRGRSSTTSRRCYRAELDALYAAGCRYVQLDDTNLAYLCDPVMRAGAVERGDDPDALPHAYAELINAAIAGRPDDLVVGIHLCRGNYRSTWFAAGRLRARGRGAVQRARRRRLLPRVRRRALGRLRPAAPRRPGQDRRARADHQQAARARAVRPAGRRASTRRPATCPSTSCA